MNEDKRYNNINISILTNKRKKNVENAINSVLGISSEEKIKYFNFNIHLLNKSVEKYAINKLEKVFTETDYFIIDWTDIDIIDDNRMWFLRFILLKKMHYTIFVKDIVLNSIIIDVDSKNIVPCRLNVNIFRNEQYMSFILNNIEEIVNKRLYRNELFYKLWFPTNTSDITLVVAVDDERPVDSALTSHNYGFVDSIADKDAVLEVSKLLSRKYPKARITVCKIENFNPQDIRKNLVVIGGPGGDEYVRADGTKMESEGNEICRKLSQNIHSRISYTNDCEEMLILDKRYRAKYDKGIMCEDIGYFSAVQNPSNLKNRIILIHGIHTLGVLGAARVFSDERDAENNYETIYKWIVNQGAKIGIDFETFFKVDVLNGEAFCPVLEMDNVFPLRDKDSFSKEKEEKGSVFNEENFDYREIMDQIKILISDMNRELPCFKTEAPKTYQETKKNLKILYELEKNENINEINTIFNDIYVKWKEITRK
ncbi:hypothetical protein [Sporofaciens sp. JLR.KK001]|uniref:hypothetical protein n=1 Tax=Sporofaciens sp. JLR.KK001 TaxID=3112621 RepID=UPI002FF2B0EF